MFVERQGIPLYTEENQDSSDFVALPYEQTGGVFSIPMTVVSPQQDATELWMIFDTGASISTLDSKQLLELGIAKFLMMHPHNFVQPMDCENLPLF